MTALPSTLAKKLAEYGLPRKLIDALFSGEKVCGEEESWTILEAARELGGETLWEDEADGENETPRYFIIVSLGNYYTIIYTATDKHCTWISTRRRLKHDIEHLTKTILRQQ